MNFVQLILAVATGAVPLTASFYTYDRLAGRSSFARSGYAALAGLGAGVLATLAMIPLTGLKTDYPVMSLNSESSVRSVSGLPDGWNAGSLPNHLGVPVNVYARQPQVVSVDTSFGTV